jgi:hypothetical protein
MERELAEIVGRPVDLVSRKAVERSHNWDSPKGHPRIRAGPLCGVTTTPFCWTFAHAAALVAKFITDQDK